MLLICVQIFGCWSSPCCCARCCIRWSLLGIGQTLFHDKAQGSLLTDAQGQCRSARGSSPSRSRPTSISNPGLRRHRTTLPPPALPTGRAAITCFATAWRAARPHREIRERPQEGPPVAPDIESWFQKDQFDGKPGIVAQWASLHSGVAGPWLHDWVKADKLNAAYVAAWEAANPDDVAKWKNDNNNPDPKPEDLAAGIAGGFFTSFSKDHPGTFPGVAEYEKDGKTAKTIGPVKEGSDIQSLFFDLWLQEQSRRRPGARSRRHGDDLRFGPGSATSRWTTPFGNWTIASPPPGRRRPEPATRKSCTTRSSSCCANKSHAPLGGLVGVPLVNMLEVNLALRDRYAEGGRRGTASNGVEANKSWAC